MHRFEVGLPIQLRFCVTDHTFGVCILLSNKIAFGGIGTSRLASLHCPMCRVGGSAVDRLCTSLLAGLVGSGGAIHRWKAFAPGVCTPMTDRLRCQLPSVWSRAVRLFDRCFMSLMTRAWVRS